MTITSNSFEIELIDSVNRLVQAASSATFNGVGWSPKVILGHVSDVDEQVWLGRINMMVQAHRAEQSRPAFSWWEPDPHATQLKYENFSLDDAITHLLSARNRLVGTLRNLNKEDWNASASHMTFGALTISGIVTQILVHDTEHLDSLG